MNIDRVVERAIVLDAMASRSSMEFAHHRRDKSAKGHAESLAELMGSLELDELDDDERAFLLGPVGGAEARKIALESSWLFEALAVLLWAIDRHPMPWFHVPADHDVMAAAVRELVEDRLEVRSWDLTLRPESELAPLRRHMTLVLWRLRQLAAGQARMDFRRELEARPNIPPAWIDSLELIDDDLAIGDTPIETFSGADDAADLMSVAYERAYACWWLKDGDRWSEVQVDTVISELE